MRIICPICKEKLQKNESSYACKNRHTFDISKQGYVNLLQKQGGKTHGDSKEMLLARKNIQDSGIYKRLSDEIIQLIKPYIKNTILDIGCGIGYYTNEIEWMYDSDITGIDISKDAIKEAAKVNKNIQYIVASNKEIPLEDNSVDLILNVFSPIYLEEALRVLKDQGVIVVASPNQNHLIELKEVIYDAIIEKEETRNTLINPNIILKSKSDICYSISLDNSKLQNLFQMTPHYWTSTIIGKDRLLKTSSLEVTFDINIAVYRKQ